jgi:hypothetical protein
LLFEGSHLTQQLVKAVVIETEEIMDIKNAEIRENMRSTLEGLEEKVG